MLCGHTSVWIWKCRYNNSEIHIWSILLSLFWAHSTFWYQFWEAIAFYILHNCLKYQGNNLIADIIETSWGSLFQVRYSFIIYLSLISNWSHWIRGRISQSFTMWRRGETWMDSSYFLLNKYRGPFEVLVFLSLQILI